MDMSSYKIRNWSSQVAQLYSVAEASKNETGGGEGVEVGVQMFQIKNIHKNGGESVEVGMQMFSEKYKLYTWKIELN